MLLEKKLLTCYPGLKNHEVKGLSFFFANVIKS